MAKICMVTLEHSPDDDRIFQKEARSLKAAGHELYILCLADPEGKVWSMGKWSQLNQDHQLEFSLEGIGVRAVTGPRNKLETLLKKGFRGPYIKRFVEAGKAIQPDVYHAHEPVSYYLSNQMARQNGAKVIFDSHESWIGGTFRERWIKRFHLQHLRYLITANSITRGHLLALNPHMATCEVYNYPQQSVFNYSLNEAKFEKVIIAHDGILPFNRGLMEMMEVLRILTSQYPNLVLRIVGTLKGQEKAYAKAKIKEYGLENHLEVTGWIPYDEVPYYLQDCSIGLILKTPQPLNNLLGGPAIKLFNYFASGMAVVDAGLHESTRFLDYTQSGISIRQRSTLAIANAIAHLIDHPDLLKIYCRRSQEAFQKFNWEKEAEKLIAFYENQILSDNTFVVR